MGAAALSECKVVHFVRHAQAESNVAAHKYPSGSPEYNAAYADPQYFDSVLSENGITQCSELHNELSASTTKLHCELVISSPLRRTLQTASVVFDGFVSTWIAHEDV